MNYNDYERIWNNSVNRTVSYAAPSKTFAGWQKSAISARKGLLAIKERFEADREAALKDYSTSKASEMIAEMQANYLRAHDVAESWVRERFNAVLEAKRETVKRACGAPTEEDLRLLSTLRLRTKLSPAEVANAAEQLSDNLVALGALADIASAAGVDTPVPTLEIIEEELARAERVGNDMIKSLDTSENAIGYLANCFYNFPEAETPISIIFGSLDESAFTSEQVQRQ